jgi:type IV secretion system protein VirB9
LTLSASTLAGQLRPASGPGDPRLQTVAYDANQVVQLQVAIGYQLTVEFAPDERVENAAVGDSSAWQVSANNRGDRLFIKLSSGGAPTNLTVMTDARTYVFELVPAEGGTSAPYMVRFVYPDGRTDPVSATGTPGAGELSSYELRGAKRLWPSAMGDDNVRTFIEWPADRALPAVFAIDDTGQEVTVDGHMRDGRYVIDTVRPKLIFRMDREVATAERILPRVRK